MASKKRNIIGNRYGDLTVLKEAGQDRYNHYCSLVRCKCGKEYIVPDTELIKGRRTMCFSCLHKTKIQHGKTGERLFIVWQSMKERCYNKKNKNYRHYGGRGIDVCDAWKNSFVAFEQWALANGYDDTLTIDRKNNDLGYSPDNCRWATKAEQANNRRNNHIIEYNGEKYTLREIARKHGLIDTTLKARLNNGWDIEEALSTPAIIGRNQYGRVNS